MELTITQRRIIVAVFTAATLTGTLFLHTFTQIANPTVAIVVLTLLILICSIAVTMAVILFLDASQRLAEKVIQFLFT